MTRVLTHPMTRDGEAAARLAGQVLGDCALPRAEARSLLAQCLGRTREQLLAHPELPVDEAGLARFDALVAERRRGVPMAYLLGWQEFHGHRLRVTPQVLVPRPETELLVDTALELLRGRGSARVLELGTGSGCIAIALALARPDLSILATDRSIDALRVAAENCRRLGARVRLAAADWYAPIAGRFDLIVSNPPYVAAGDEHLAQLRFEPRAALTDGGDGISALRTIVRCAPPRLAPGGRVLVEHGYDQAARVRGLMTECGFARATTLRDLAGIERACVGALAGDGAAGGVG